MTGSSPSSSPPARPKLEEITQVRYERTFKAELSKLETAIADERITKHAIQQQQLEAEAAERNRKSWDESRATKLRAMEQAIQFATEQQQKRFLRNRAAASKKILAKDAQAEKQRQQVAKERNEQMKQVAQAHANTLAKFADERRQVDDKVRAANQEREEKLLARLAADREALQLRNDQRADEAARKVQHAAHLRENMAEKQRAQFKARETAQQDRMCAQKAAHEKRLANLRAAAHAKKLAMDRAQQQQQALDEQRRNQILSLEEEKKQRLASRMASNAEARRQKQLETSLHEAAARRRATQRLGEDARMRADREEQIDQRMSLVESLVAKRLTDEQEARRLAVRLSIERAQLSNSMTQLRTNLTSSDPSLVVELPSDRRRVQDKELKALFDRVDPDAVGQIHLPKVKKTIGKQIAAYAKPMKSNHPKRMHASRSMPSLVPEHPTRSSNLSLHEKCVEAFKAVDQDGSNTISKRELIKVLRSMGLKDTKNALELFNGFDADGNGELDFEEFLHIAKTVLV